MPGTVLRTGDTSKNKTDKHPFMYFECIWRQLFTGEMLRTNTEAVHLGMKSDKSYLTVLSF